MKELSSIEELNKDKISIIKFGAIWCGSCREIQFKLENLISSFPSLDFWSLDVDEHLDIADSYKVNELPVVIAFKKGKEISRWDESVGDIADWLKFLVSF